MLRVAIPGFARGMQLAESARAVPIGKQRLARYDIHVNFDSKGSKQLAISFAYMRSYFNRGVVWAS